MNNQQKENRRVYVNKIHTKTPPPPKYNPPKKTPTRCLFTPSQNVTFHSMLRKRRVDFIHPQRFGNLAIVKPSYEYTRQCLHVYMICQ